jgi:hypothetical protein
MPIFRPSSTLKLILRTEEFNRTEVLDQLLEDPFNDATNDPRTQANSPQAPSGNEQASIESRLQRNQERLIELERRRDDLPPDIFQAQRNEIRQEREQILKETQIGATTTQPPTAINGEPPDELTVFGNILPISAQIERNGLSTAGTATIDINYIDAPFDPRILRSAHVELIIGVVPASDFEDGIRGARRADGSLLSVVGANDDGTLQGATRFVGFVDDWEVNYSDEGDIISLRCRDMSALLRDLELQQGDSIDLTLPIDEGVAKFVDTASRTTQGINIIYRGENIPPVPSESIPQRRGARRGRQRRRARRGDEKMSLWDHITDTVGALGLIAIVEDYDLVITEARTLFSTSGTQRMVYGINLKSLNFVRKLQGIKVPTIEVRCYDPELGRVRWARYPFANRNQASGVFGINDPPRASRANVVPPSGANPTESIKSIRVSGINNPNTLERIARNSFEQIGRQEIEGTFETNDISSVDTDVNEADLLNLNAGNPIDILMLASNQEGENSDLSSNVSLSQLEALGRAQRKEYLISRGWSAKVASRFAELQDATGFQTIFRIQDVRISWDNEEGIKINSGFINYITVREDENATTT